MRAFVASSFTGFAGLALQNIPTPTPAQDHLLIRVVAAGVNVVDHSILHGKMPMVTAPLLLSNEGSGIVEQGDADFPAGTRVAFGGPFGVLEPGTYAENIAVPKAMLYRVPDNIDLIEAAGLPVAYISAFMALEMAGFATGKIVYAPGVFGGIGNATLQLARALSAKQVISSTASTDKASRARAAGFDHVIDMSKVPLVETIRGMTDEYGVDVVIDGLSGPILSASLDVLAPRGTIVTVGYSAGRDATIDVTNLIWKSGQIKGFNFLMESSERREQAWQAVSSLLIDKSIWPVIDRIFSFDETAEAMRYLVEERPSPGLLAWCGQRRRSFGFGLSDGCLRICHRVPNSEAGDGPRWPGRSADDGRISEHRHVQPRERHWCLGRWCNNRGGPRACFAKLGGRNSISYRIWAGRDRMGEQ